MPSWPMAMPSSTAIVLNSAAKQPWLSTIDLTCCPMSCRCVCPGTVWVKELTTATIGLPNCSSFIPLARQRAREPAISRPNVLALLRRGIRIVCSPLLE